MNASRRVLRASTNTVKKIYSFGEKSIQGHVIEGTIIVILIVLTAVVLNFLPLNFLCFFNNIIVKVIFLIVIAFVALYCPAIGLMLAILLVSIIQMCQRKQLSMEIGNIQSGGGQTIESMPPGDPRRTMENMPSGDPLGNVMESYGGTQENLMESYGGTQENLMESYGGTQENLMESYGGTQENLMESYGGTQENLMESYGGTQENLMESYGGTQENLMESYGGTQENLMESYSNRGGHMEPQGFNDDTSCVAGCGGSGSGGKRDNRRELNGMCGNVKTWTNQESAQGLDGEVVGLQSSIGYPL
jgi:hypothetical protein